MFASRIFLSTTPDILEAEVSSWLKINDKNIKEVLDVSQNVSFGDDHTVKKIVLTVTYEVKE